MEYLESDVAEMAAKVDATNICTSEARKPLGVFTFADSSTTLHYKSKAVVAGIY